MTTEERLIHIETLLEGHIRTYKEDQDDRKEHRRAEDKARLENTATIAVLKTRVAIQGKMLWGAVGACGTLMVELLTRHLA